VALAYIGKVSIPMAFSVQGTDIAACPLSSGRANFLNRAISYRGDGSSGGRAARILANF